MFLAVITDPWIYRLMNGALQMDTRWYRILGKHLIIINVDNKWGRDNLPQYVQPDYTKGENLGILRF